MEFNKHNEVRYAFMFWSHQENKWVRCNRLFHLSNYLNSTLFGQFITDMEFNVVIEDEKPKHFIIVGVKDKESYTSLGSMINDNLNTPSISNLKKLNLCFKEYFMIRDWTKYKNNILNKEKSGNYKMFGEFNGKNILELKFNYHDNYGIMCCLPSFELIV